MQTGKSEEKKGVKGNIVASCFIYLRPVAKPGQVEIPQLES